jgi:lipopolysaccharide biosynthesis glycosyltransferase
MLPEISVAVCADKHIEVGLHVTLYSLLESSLRPVKIYFLQKGYCSRDIESLRKTLGPFSGLYKLIILDFDDSVFSRYRGLQGNKFTYARIMLASIIHEERVIYLDSDLVIKRDLGDLFHADLNGHVVGVAGVGNIEWALEREFFTSIGLDKEAKYFNAGVLVMDLDKWRAFNITRKCIEFADKYPDMLLTADQTVLNYVFYRNNFCELDKSYNRALYADSNSVDPAESGSVFHFVGAPKPWDFCGEFIHNNYPLFQSMLKNTSFSNYRSYFNLTFYSVKRTFRLYRAYYRLLTKRHA